LSSVSFLGTCLRRVLEEGFGLCFTQATFKRKTVAWESIKKWCY
jgi:hypothetical protein